MANRLVDLSIAQRATVTSCAWDVFFVSNVWFPHFLVVANGGGFQATARTRYLRLNVRHLNERLRALLRRRPMGVKRGKEVRASKILGRRGRLCAYLRVILRIRLIFGRLSGERRRINVSRPARSMVRSKGIRVLRALTSTITREDRRRGKGDKILNFSSTHGIGRVVVIHAQRASGRIRKYFHRLAFNFFLQDRLVRAKQVARAGFCVFVGSFLLSPAIVLRRRDVMEVNGGRCVRGAPLRRVSGDHITRRKALFVLFIYRDPYFVFRAGGRGGL